MKERPILSPPLAIDDQAGVFWCSVELRMFFVPSCVSSLDPRYVGRSTVELPSRKKNRKHNTEEENGTDDKNQTAMLSRTDTHTLWPVGRESFNKCQASKSYRNVHSTE
ncbi:hypothetical protein OUZ56_013920 [Daphnia magna]|uniref:Uncharacterized protein n=1 Tax=Daphnia magna TaxID=35525 RepID=A0ABQ9Z7C6_9CRUS|nr:hypothetical protein OUZ56_013920 [Daphnia magna]